MSKVIDQAPPPPPPDLKRNFFSIDSDTQQLQVQIIKEKKFSIDSAHLQVQIISNLLIQHDKAYMQLHWQ